MTDDEIKTRIESPLNLLNRLRSLTNNHSTHPALPPKISDVMKDVDEKLNDANNSVKGKANTILLAAMDELHKRIPEVQKPERLASIVKDMSVVVDNQNKNNKKDDEELPRIVVYAPQIRNENEYNIIHVTE